jgi:ribonuclease HIII
MKYLILISVPDSGQISDFKKKEIGRALNEFRGKNVMLTIERKYNKRSNQQSRFFHGILTWYIQPALIEQGWYEAKSEAWTKEFVKDKVLKKEFYNEKTGEITVIPGKTSELSTVEFMSMISEIQMWASQYLGIEIPDPNSQTEMF